MADPITKGALAQAFPNPANINPAELSDEQLAAYQQSTRDILKSLEDRYAQPNLWKVAAAFAKPQLGGFFASLGNASEALGENMEQQRAIALPIAQMKAQLNQSEILMGQNKKATDLIAERKASGKPIDSAFVQRLEELAPNAPATKSLKSQLEFDVRNRGLQQQEYTAARKQLQDNFEAGLITKEQLQSGINQLNTLNPFNTTTQARPEPTATPLMDDKARQRVEGDIAGLKRELSGLPANDSRRPILEKELTDRQALIGVFGADNVGTTRSSLSQEGKAEPEAKKEEKIQVLPTRTVGIDPTNPASGISEANKATNAKREKEAQDRWDVISAVGSPEARNQFLKPIDATLSVLQNKDGTLNPKAKEVLAVMNQGGWLSGILNAVDRERGGLSVGTSMWQANIGLPVKTFVEAKFPPELQQVAQTLALNLAQIKMQEQKLQGIAPSTARNAELQMLSSSNVSTSTLAPVLLGELLKKKLAVQEKANLYDYTTNVLDNKGEYRLDPNSRTPYNDVLNSDRFRAITDSHKHVFDKLSDRFREPSK